MLFRLEGMVSDWDSRKKCFEFDIGKAVLVYRFGPIVIRQAVGTAHLSYRAQEGPEWVRMKKSIRYDVTAFGRWKSRA